MRCRGKGFQLVRNRQRGFTMIEILAAFSVFVLAFAMALQILSGSIQNTRRSSEYTQAALWAQSIMETIGLERPVEDSLEQDHFNDEYSYSLSIEPYVLEGDDGLLREAVPVDLYRVELVVGWGDENRPREARFVTLRSVRGEQL
jgi:general secretion pathway protein I